MGIGRRIAVFLGFARDDGHESRDQEEADDENNQAHQRPNFQETGLPRRGFSVPVQVTVDRSHPAPLLHPCSSGDGGVQGLRWHAKRLRIDEDGDVADEFLDEVLPEAPSNVEGKVLPEAPSNVEDQARPLPRFNVKYSTKPAKVKNQIMSHDGKIQQCVEYQGRLQWV